MKKDQLWGAVELETLNIVWDKGEATVQAVLDAILQNRQVAYTTVLTMMRNLAKKGFLDHRVDGRTYIYHATVEPEVIRGSLLKDTLEKVFQGSSVELVQSLLHKEKLTEDEVAQIKKLIEEL